MTKIAADFMACLNPDKIGVLQAHFASKRISGAPPEQSGACENIEGIDQISDRMSNRFSLTDRSADPGDLADMPTLPTTRANEKKRAVAKRVHQTESAREDRSAPKDPLANPLPGAIRRAINGPATFMPGVVCIACQNDQDRCTWRPPVGRILTSCDPCMKARRQCELAYHTTDASYPVLHPSEVAQMRFVFRSGWDGLRQSLEAIERRIRVMQDVQARLTSALVNFAQVYEQWRPLYDDYLKSRNLAVGYSVGEHVIGSTRVRFMEPSEHWSTTPAIPKSEKTEVQE